VAHSIGRLSSFYTRQNIVEGRSTVATLDVPEGEGDELIRVWSINPAMGHAAAKFSAMVYERSELPVNEREMARMRIAQINDCPV
jgi:alkylhydroperoxidase family enzyme